MGNCNPLVADAPDMNTSPRPETAPSTGWRCLPFEEDEEEGESTPALSRAEKSKPALGDASSYYISAERTKIHHEELEEEEKAKHIETLSSLEMSREEYLRTLDEETKKCIAAAHLFGRIWHEFFTDEENKCEYLDYDDDNSDYFDILDHILVRGGCLRDVVWGKNFNDVDAAVNTRELNKLHLLHLKKYHSTKETQENSNCILWLHYAKKFDQESTAKETASDFDDDKMGEKIIKSPYMLNAKFLLDILQNDERLDQKISVAIMGRTGRVWNIQIIDGLQYAGHDLTGFDFDFLDIKYGIFAGKQERDDLQKQHKLNRQRSATLKPSVKQNDRYRAMHSIRIQSKLKIFNNTKQDYAAYPIDLPIYPLTFIAMSKLCDVTMNSMLVHFADIIKNEHGEYTLDFAKKPIDYDWRAKIRNAAVDMDGVKDTKEKYIRIHGSSLQAAKTNIGANNGKYQLFRMVKMWAVKLEGKGTLDPVLVDAHIEMYDSWFSKEKFLENDAYCKEIARRIIHDYTKKGTMKLRFECMERMKFNDVCKRVMQEVPNLKKYLSEQVEGIEDEEWKQETKDAMNLYQYDI